jgi:hypothetical protein
MNSSLVLRLLLATLIVGAAIGFWFISKSPSSGDDVATAHTRSDQTAAPHPQAELNDQGPAVGAETNVSPMAATSRREVEALVPAQAAVVDPGTEQQDAQGPQLEIRVIHKVGGAPVAGIEVFALEFEQQVPPPAEWLEVLQAEGLGPMVERFGAARRTDDKGICQIPLPQGSLFARAHGLGLVGASNAEQVPSNPLVIEVEPVGGHRVFAHGPSGEPIAGVRVGLVPLENTQDSEEPLFLMAAGETAGSPPSALLSPPPEMKDRFSQMKLAVLALGLFAQPVSVELTNPMGPGEEVHLQLPQCGSVVLRLTDQAAQQNSPKTYELAIAGGSSYRLPVALENGIGRNDWVQFGQSIEVSSMALNAESFERQQLAVFEGPTEENPVVEFLLEPPPSPLISGIALDPDGKPLAGHRLWWSSPRTDMAPGPLGQILVAGGSTEQELYPVAVDSEQDLPEALGNALTDAAGRFEFRADWVTQLLNANRGGQTRGVRVEARRGAVLAGEMELPVSAFESSGLTIDLGELRFQAVPLLIAGRVLDMDGQPVPGSLTYVACDGPEDPVLENLWQPDELRTGGGGQFDIRQRSAKAQVRLEFYSDFHVTRNPVFAPRGATAFQLTVAGAGGLVYGTTPSSSLPESFFLSNLRTRLVAEGQSETDSALERATQIRIQGPDGRYRFLGIPEGVYSLTISLGSLGFPEYDRSAITIRGGEVTDLGTLDFSRGLTFLDVRFDPPVPEGVLPWLSLDPDHPIDAALLNRYDDGELHWILVGRGLPSRLRLYCGQSSIEGVVDGTTLNLPWPQ